jgi:hypothetical protein
VARQNRGLATLLDEFILPAADQLEGEERSRLDAAVATVRAAAGEHQAWLDETLVPNAAGDFRAGAQRYDQQLAFALSSSLGRGEIRKRAEAELARVREEMYAVAQGVLKNRADAPPTPDQPDDGQRQAAIEAALELSYAERPDRDEVVDFAKHTLEVATEFVRAKDLVTVPDEPVKIILMPEFQRGVSVAYCDSPGPLDKGLDTYYAISPIPDEWDQAKVESFLREYNDYMIHVLSIHEAMPGHYLEGVHSAEHPSADAAAGVRTTAVALGLPRAYVLVRVLLLGAALYAGLLFAWWIAVLPLLAALLPISQVNIDQHWHRVRVLLGLALLAEAALVYMGSA